MKKLIALLPLIVLFVIGCSSEQRPIPKDFHYSTTCEGTTTIKNPVLAPINLCNGKKSAYKKVIGWKDSALFINNSVDVIIPSDSLKKAGFNYFAAGTDPKISTPSDFGWLWNILKWIAAIVLLFLIVWGLWWLFSQLEWPRWRRSTPLNDNAVNTAANNTYGPQSQTTATGLAALAGTMKNGGSATVNTDGTFILEVYPIYPLVTIEVGDNNTGDIITTFAKTKVTKAPGEPKKDTSVH